MLHRCYDSARKEKTDRPRITTRRRICRRDSPIVIASRKFTYNVAFARYWPVDKHVLKFVIRRNLQPVSRDALLFVPLDCCRESDLASGGLLRSSTESKTTQTKDRS